MQPLHSFRRMSLLSIGVWLSCAAFASSSFSNTTMTLPSNSSSLAVGSRHAELSTTSRSGSESVGSTTASYNMSYFSATPTYTYPIYTVVANTSESGIEAAMKCWSSIATWRNESAIWWNAKIADRTWAITSSYSSTTTFTHITTTYYPSNPSTYTLCDGSARVNERPKTTEYSEITTLFGSFTETLMPTFAPQPCSLKKSDCRMIHLDTNVEETDDRELLRQCGNPAHLGDSLECLLGGGPVELIFFPVESKDNATFCSGEGPNATSLVTARPLLSGLSDVTTLGSTFSRDSVYISFKTLFASYDGFWDKIGPTFTDYIVPLHSTDISTHCGGWGQAYGAGTQLDYADLNWPVPASAYKCQDRCRMQKVNRPVLTDGSLLALVDTTIAGPECETIWSDINPVLAVPTKIRDMVPEWASCSFWNQNIANFWFDPPIALQPAEVAASPTLPSPRTTTAARPESTLLDPVAGRTTNAGPHVTVISDSDSTSLPKKASTQGLDATGVGASAVTKIVLSTVSLRYDPQTSADTQYETPALEGQGPQASNTGEPQVELAPSPDATHTLENTRSPTNSEISRAATSSARRESEQAPSLAFSYVPPSSAEPADASTHAPTPNLESSGTSDDDTMTTYTTDVDPHIAGGAAFSILTAALSTYHSDAPTLSFALSSLSVSQVSQATQPQPAAGTNTKATSIPFSENPNTESNNMATPTAAGPTATAIDGGIIPSLATIGSIIVLTGDDYTVTAAIPSANTDAIALISATLSLGGDAVTMSDATYSLGSSGLQIIASETTALLQQSTYGAGQTQSTSDTYGSVSYPSVVTMSTSTSESSSSAEETSSTTEASTTSRQTSSSATTAAPASTSTEASAGQKHKVMWSMGGMAMLAAMVVAL